MALRVLIVEDQSDLQSLVHEHLHNAFRRSARDGWPDGWPKDAEKHLEIDVLTKVELNALCRLKRTSAIRRRLERRDGPPHVIITDLALSKDEVDELEDAGGTEPTGAEDPRDQLNSTTGFQILEAMSSVVPVIATTYASNPLVSEACWKAGAHAVILKPASDKEMAAYYEYWKLSKNPVAKLTEAQQEVAWKYGQRIEVYLQAMTHEVLKGVQARALSRMESVVPRRLPYWVALNHEELEGRQIAGTSLMLLEIEGFSLLAKQGKSRPKALFRMMNEIWDQVQPLLADSDAEINHFAGDAALIFRGVYDEEDAGCRLADTLRCGAEISKLFEFRGRIRAELAKVIQESYSTLPRQRVEGMKKFVEGLTGTSSTERLNARVISTEPPEEDALYGRVGASSRWQHSTLSRGANLLKAAKGVLDESQDLYSQTQGEKSFRQEGESFLVTGRMDPPEVPGFAIQSLQDILQAKPPEHPELRGLEIHRVFRASSSAGVQ